MYKARRLPGPTTSTICDHSPESVREGVNVFNRFELAHNLAQGETLAQPPRDGEGAPPETTGKVLKSLGELKLRDAQKR
jgi:hypothetical protein